MTEIRAWRGSKNDKEKLVRVHLSAEKREGFPSSRGFSLISVPGDVITPFLNPQRLVGGALRGPESIRFAKI
jgi:hypothetical protein